MKKISWEEGLLPMVLVAGTVMFFASTMALLAVGICACLFLLAIASVIDHAFGIRLREVKLKIS